MTNLWKTGTVSVMVLGMVLICFTPTANGELLHQTASMFETDISSNTFVYTDTKPHLRLAMNVWCELHPTHKPSGRWDHAMAYDSTNRKVVLFGGYCNGVLSDTWLYDYTTNSWQNMDPTTAPDGRYEHAMIYDPHNNKIILFGGTDGSVYKSDTWSYDVATNTWSNRNPTTNPTGRYGHGMVYDTVNRKVILFGGVTSAGYTDETWAYDYSTNTWTNMAPVIKPSARRDFAMAFDSSAGRTVLFGGYASGGRSSETWIYNYAGNSWSERSPSGSPRALDNTAMVYDSTYNKCILFGGYDGTYAYSDTWAYDYARDRWTRLNPCVSPSRHHSHAMVYNPDAKHMFLFSGLDSRVGENWVYSYKQTSGTYTSGIFDAGMEVRWISIQWSPQSQLPGTTLKFQLATNNDAITWNFVGPGGSASAYYTVPTGELIWSAQKGRFLRYRAYLDTTSDNTPRLDEITIAYSSAGSISVRLTSPNGGEDWLKGQSYPITWESTGTAESVDIHYTTDAGQTWTSIVTGAPNTGYYRWTVPSVTTSAALIKITLTDAHGRTVSDISDATFAIDPPAEGSPATGSQQTGESKTSSGTPAGQMNTYVLAGLSAAVILSSIVVTVMYLRKPGKSYGPKKLRRRETKR